jgi:predicted small lipoprotein YifL
MKNVLKTFGIIALAAVIGFSMVACGGIYEKID